MEKDILRKKYLNIRKNIDQEDKKKYDKDIFNKLTKLKEFKNAEKILVYVSLKDEVDTIRIIDYCLKIGKKVSVPKCKGNTIEFYNINSINELKSGSFGIKEPEEKNKTVDFNSSICIVPGIAFDRNNNRLGYGKGFYDRFLEKYRFLKIGLAYKECLCEDIDVNKYDIKMDLIIS